jgi:hypothetical protein
VQCLLDLIPLVITEKWVKGNYTGKNKEIKLILKEEANHLVTSFQQQ